MAENEEIIMYIKRAFELKNQKCYKQAIEMLYKAIALEPDNVEIMFQLGELYYLLENYSRAIQYPEQILEQDSEHIQALELLKNIYLQQGELFSAKEIAEKLYTIDNSEKNLSSLIEIYARLDLTEEIEKHIDKIKQSEKCLYAYAKALFDTTNIEKSENFVDLALESNPQNEECLILKGKILFNKNETENAREIFSRFNMYSENPEILNFLGLFALEDLNILDAIKAFAKASSLDKKNALYSYNLGNAYFLNGWLDESVNAYKNAICLEPENLEFRYSLAYLFFENRDFIKAQNEVEYILQKDMRHSGANVLKALLLYEKHNYIEAEMLLKAAIEKGDPDNFTLTSYAKIEKELGKYSAAEKCIKTALEKDSENLTYKYELGEIYIKSKQFEAAIELAENINNDNPNFIAGCILGANAAYEAGSYEQAKSFAQKALAIDINCSQGYYYLALVRMQEEDYEEAIECMKRAIIYDVTNAEYYAKMAEIYKRFGDIKSAFEYIKEAESIDESEKYKQLFKEYAAEIRS